MATPDPDPALHPPGDEDAEHLVDLTAAPEAAAPLVPAEIIAQSLGDYFRARLVRIRSGDSGFLPVLVGMVAIVIVFQIISPNHSFLTAGNIVNLFQQSAVYITLGMAEIFVLLLGEIDLSLGYLGPVGAVIAIQLVEPASGNWPWEPAVVVALLCCAFIGFIQGSLVSRLGIPSFIVTLAGLLILNGAMLLLLAIGPFSGYPSLNGKSGNLHALYQFMWGHVSPVTGWIAMAVVVGLLGLFTILRDARRRRAGLVAPPLSVNLIKMGVIAAAGVVVVIICNLNRANIGVLSGVPYAIFIVLGVLAVWTFLLSRMRYGRYLYAIGGNAEAARRAGVNVARIRTMAFVLAAVTAGVAGLLYASYLGGMSNNVNGGQLVLYAVAAAVIGGTSLLGGRGKVSAGILGGLVIGGINNGLYLMGLQVQWQFIVTGGVLMAAVLIDALSRRRAVASGVR
ncbi:MAG: ABC transporter permease [Acidobacteriota bacterium]|nr:ABC transporter permease [Acidobacteriota bacterium]